MIRFFLTLLAASLALERATGEQMLFSENFSHEVSNRWNNVAFFKKPTDYQIHHEGTNSFVVGVADKACSAFSIKLDIPPPDKLVLRWHWRIDGVNANGSERDLSKFDHAARVFVAFDTLIGPPRTINYMWGNIEKPGTILQHPKSNRAQLIILESGNSKAGSWVAEERDVTADWKKVFPDKTMPKIVGLGVMTDSDSLGGTLTGAYSDIELIGK